MYTYAQHLQCLEYLMSYCCLGRQLTQCALLLNVDSAQDGAKTTPCNLSQNQNHDPLDGGLLVDDICTDTNGTHAGDSVHEAVPLEQVPQDQYRHTSCVPLAAIAIVQSSCQGDCPDVVRTLNRRHANQPCFPEQFPAGCKIQSRTDTGLITKRSVVCCQTAGQETAAQQAYVAK